MKDDNGRFEDYSISPKIRQILWSWISWKWIAIIYFFVHVKMSYY